MNIVCRELNHDLMSIASDLSCDRQKHFFRLNYEYDGRCGRIATVWWPQILVLCLLIFFIILAILGLLLLFRQRQHRIAKRFD